MIYHSIKAVQWAQLQTQNCKPKAGTSKRACHHRQHVSRTVKILQESQKWEEKTTNETGLVIMDFVDVTNMDVANDPERKPTLKAAE